MAVLALIYIVPRFRNISLRRLDLLPLWGQNIIRYIYLSALVCSAVTIGTLPLIMYYSNRVSSITIIANLILVPLLGNISADYIHVFYPHSLLFPGNCRLFH